ncbi:MAG: hypothetical protein M1836_002021 [Candelina mexicana]|nr:MAG: hypothetical protein M1836_002021 [Candelina mexicana]
MSASPSGLPSGPTPNGGPAPRRRRPQAADPLRRPNDRNRTRRQIPSGASGAKTNGLPIIGNNKAQAKPAQRPAKSTATSTVQPPSLGAVLTGGGDETSGFSSTPKAPFTDYPLVTTKRALMEGMRYHVARFASKKDVNPTDQTEFTRPVRLHRRDPRAPVAGGGNLKNEDVKDTGLMDGVLDDKERERQEILRAEREKQRAENLAQIAPTAHAGNHKKPNAFNNKKTQQAYDKDDDPEATYQKKLRYEESLPWHLEDFDNKNTWVGNYEAALSGTYAMLVMQPNQTISMVPLSKWYKFTSKNQFKTLSIEEAESRMKKPIKEPRWFMDSQKASEERRVKEKKGNPGKGLFLGKDLGSEEGTTIADPTAGVVKKEAPADADDLDYEEDRFADDEENKLFEGDEDEAKEAEERIKRDHLQANFFDQKEEKQYDKAEEEEKKEKELEKDLGKGVKKALKKREKNYIYDSDSENPYTEESESEDTEAEAERLKEEERKKEEEKKASIEKEKDTKGKGKDLEKPSSGASTKGTNTPSHRPKPNDTSKKSNSSSLKRPGSPNLSEASGTESSRKKPKKSHHKPSSSQPTGTSTPTPGSRPMSPAPPPSSVPESTRPQQQQRKSSIVKIPIEPSKLNEISAAIPRPDGKRPRQHAGSGSDGEATGGEMSDGARKKIKLRMSPKNGTPQGSRAGSPDLLSAGAQARAPPHANGGRAGSPAGAAPSDAARPPNPVRPDPISVVSEEEIRKAIPATGTTIPELLVLFRGRVGNKGRFIELVKANSKFLEKRLFPRATTGSSGVAN